MKNIQRVRIYNLLKTSQGRWVPLPDILALGCAQYGARILELRREGYRIINRTEVVRDLYGANIRHSYFMLVDEPMAALKDKF